MWIINFENIIMDSTVGYTLKIVSTEYENR